MWSRCWPLFMVVVVVCNVAGVAAVVVVYGVVDVFAYMKQCEREQ